MLADVLLSLGRALWEQVTPDLREVTVSCQGTSKQGSIRAPFLYEGEVGTVQAQCVSEAEGYCIADFPPEVAVEFQPVSNAARDLLPGESWVFICWEPEA